MKRLARLLATICVLWGCEPDATTEIARKPDPASSERMDPLLYRSRQVSHRLEAALSRLAEPMPAVTKFHTTACPDTELEARVSAGTAPTLVLDIHDARYEARSLLPLELVAPLDPPTPTLDRYFEPDPRAASLLGSDARLSRLLRSEEDGRAAEREIEEFERRGYKGVFHITQFKKPHLIRKENRRKREWTRGVFEAWFVVYDIDTSESLCQARVSTSSDVEGEPISIRLRPDTQRRLVRELGQQLYSETAQVLGSISRVLRLEAAEGVPTNEQRANAPTALNDAARRQDAGHSPGRQ